MRAVPGALGLHTYLGAALAFGELTAECSLVRKLVVMMEPTLHSGALSHPEEPRTEFCLSCCLSLTWVQKQGRVCQTEGPANGEA